MHTPDELADQFDMNSKQRIIDRVLVRELMKETDLERLGVVYAFVTEGLRRIQPPLDFDECFRFLRDYYARCLRENLQQTRWACTRYTAGRDLVNWFASMFHDPNIARSYLVDLKRWMADLYEHGDDELRTCLVTATLEHLFEQKEIRKFFADWKEKSTLAPAYEQAMEWVTRGGSTPLGKREWLNKASRFD